MIKIFRLVFFILLLCSASFLFSQTGGQRVYSFLNLPSSARVTAGGGAVMALTDADVSLSYHNPALLNRQMHGRITASTAAYYAGINFGYFGYAHNIKNIVMMQGGIQYLAYGTFKGADVTGNENGTFKANEIALHAGVSRTYGTKYHYGMNLKLISSSYESYSSFGLSTDWAAAYFDSARNFTASLLIKNIGFQFKPYIKGNRDPLPVDIQLGFSKRLKHVPFRIGVVAHSLNRFNMRYEDNTEQTNVVFGDTAESECCPSFYSEWRVLLWQSGRARFRLQSSAQKRNGSRNQKGISRFFGGAWYQYQNVFFLVCPRQASHSRCIQSVYHCR
jgi:hypothetical protein